ncbi:MAG: flagellar assembly peptidoglycan hydrolase FlgJ [Gammaproteobacteria bacterium]|nr:flagellar assembly peptidoglycan hydrolase FlgJ [Gammaproteobacteria bacterium]
MAITDQPGFFLDFQRFGELKLQARTDRGHAAVAVAQQFEGLFLQQMLAAMRAAATVDQGQHSSTLDFYREMHDKQLAQTIAGQGGLGVARLIAARMPGSTDSAVAQAASMAALPARVPAGAAPPLPVAAAVSASSPATAGGVAVPVGAAVSKTLATPPAGVAAAADATVSKTPPAGVVLHRVLNDDFAEVAQNAALNQRWQQPARFVADLLPEAQDAAARLGVSPELLIAQAALETGWGKHVMQFDDGRSSFNLFGIKAGADWQGGSLQRASLEFSDGALHSQVSRFRAYASPAHSLRDYVDFIQSSPRYGDALQTSDDSGYIRAIHAAGYATDPDYADKVIAILRGDLLRTSLAQTAPGDKNNA